jgi:hypothetical protein
MSLSEEILLLLTDCVTTDPAAARLLEMLVRADESVHEEPERIGNIEVPKL